MFLDEEWQHDKSGTLLACKRVVVLELAAKRSRSDFDSRLPGKAQRLSFDIAPHEKLICEPRMSQFDAMRGILNAPRSSAYPEDMGTTYYTFHFQISNGGGRRACSVKVQALNIQDAKKFFRQNWQIIEVMAREDLANGSREDGEIRLLVP
jgi:hypothetical protein